MSPADARKVADSARLELGAGDATADQRRAHERALAGAREGFAAMARENPAEWAGVLNDMSIWRVRESVITSMKQAVTAIVTQSERADRVAKKAAIVEVPKVGPGLPHCTDMGNARRFVARHASGFRFCPSVAHGGWLHWTGANWQADESGASARAAKTIAAMVRAEAPIAAREAAEAAAEKPDLAAEKAFAERMGWADQSESMGRLEAVLWTAKTEPEIAVKRADLDVNPWLFNTPDGTLDLSRDYSYDNRREDLLTQIGGVGHTPGASCPRWEAFVSEIMGGDADMVAYLRRIAGYAMVGVVREPAFFIFWGGGRNGKGTFIERLRNVLGTYATNTMTSTFLDRRAGGVPNDLAALAGKRLVTMSESAGGTPLEESLVKQVTGRDPVTCRYMRAEFFDYIPQFIPILSTQEKPIIKGTDAGIWARIHLVPFTVSFVGREDLGLSDALDLELAGILNWCLDGVADWRDNGLKPPAPAMKAGTDYRSEMDIVGRFMEDCVHESSLETVANSDMYRAFAAWCKENGEKDKSQRWLTQKLTDRGLRQKTGTRAWPGLSLIPGK